MSNDLISRDNLVYKRLPHWRLFAEHAPRPALLRTMGKMRLRVEPSSRTIHPSIRINNYLYTEICDQVERIDVFQRRVAYFRQGGIMVDETMHAA